MNFHQQISSNRSSSNFGNTPLRLQYLFPNKKFKTINDIEKIEEDISIITENFLLNYPNYTRVLNFRNKYSKYLNKSYNDLVLIIKEFDDFDLFEYFDNVSYNKNSLYEKKHFLQMKNNILLSILICAKEQQVIEKNEIKKKSSIYSNNINGSNIIDLDNSHSNIIKRIKSNENTNTIIHNFNFNKSINNDVTKLNNSNSKDNKYNINITIYNNNFNYNYDRNNFNNNSNYDNINSKENNNNLSFEDEEIFSDLSFLDFIIEEIISSIVDENNTDFIDVNNGNIVTSPKTKRFKEISETLSINQNLNKKNLSSNNTIYYNNIDCDSDLEIYFTFEYDYEIEVYFLSLLDYKQSAISIYQKFSNYFKIFIDNLNLPSFDNEKSNILNNTLTFKDIILITSEKTKFNQFSVPELIVIRKILANSAKRNFYTGINFFLKIDEYNIFLSEGRIWKEIGMNINKKKVYEIWNMYYSNIEMIRKTKLKSTIQIEFKQQLDKIKMKLNELKRTMTNNNNNDNINKNKNINNQDEFNNKDDDNDKNDNIIKKNKLLFKKNEIEKINQLYFVTCLKELLVIFFKYDLKELVLYFLQQIKIHKKIPLEIFEICLQYDEDICINIMNDILTKDNVKENYMQICIFKKYFTLGNLLSKFKVCKNYLNTQPTKSNEKYMLLLYKYMNRIKKNEFNKALFVKKRFNEGDKLITMFKEDNNTINKDSNDFTNNNNYFININGNNMNYNNNSNTYTNNYYNYHYYNTNITNTHMNNNNGGYTGRNHYHNHYYSNNLLNKIESSKFNVNSHNVSSIVDNINTSVKNGGIKYNQNNNLNKNKTILSDIINPRFSLNITSPSITKDKKNYFKNKIHNINNNNIIINNLKSPNKNLLALPNFSIYAQLVNKKIDNNHFSNKSIKTYSRDLNNSKSNLLNMSYFSPKKAKKKSNLKLIKNKSFNFLPTFKRFINNIKNLNTQKSNLILKDPSNNKKTVLNNINMKKSKNNKNISNKKKSSIDSSIDGIFSSIQSSKSDLNIQLILIEHLCFGQYLYNCISLLISINLSSINPKYIERTCQYLLTYTTSSDAIAKCPYPLLSLVLSAEYLIKIGKLNKKLQNKTNTVANELLKLALSIQQSINNLDTLNYYLCRQFDNNGRNTLMICAINEFDILLGDKSVGDIVGKMWYGVGHKQSIFRFFRLTRILKANMNYEYYDDVIDKKYNIGQNIIYSFQFNYYINNSSHRSNFELFNTIIICLSYQVLIYFYVDSTKKKSLDFDENKKKWNLYKIYMSIINSFTFLNLLSNFFHFVFYKLTNRRIKINKYKFIIEIIFFSSVFLVWIDFTDLVVNFKEDKDTYTLIEGILYSLVISSSWLRIINVLFLSNAFGSFLRIVFHISWHVFMFLLIVVCFTFCFAQCFTIFFKNSNDDFKIIYKSFITLFISSFGQVNFENFEHLTLLGYGFLITFTVISNLLLFNLIVGIINNLFNFLEEKNESQSRSILIIVHEKIKWDDRYGLLILLPAPLNLCSIFFIPILIIISQVCDNEKIIKKYNLIFSKIAYFFIAIFYFFGIFLTGIIIYFFAVIKTIIFIIYYNTKSFQNKTFFGKILVINLIPFKLIYYFIEDLIIYWKLVYKMPIEKKNNEKKNKLTKDFILALRKVLIKFKYKQKKKIISLEELYLKLGLLDSNRKSLKFLHENMISPSSRNSINNNKHFLNMYNSITNNHEEQLIKKNMMKNLINKIIDDEEYIDIDRTLLILPYKVIYDEKFFENLYYMNIRIYLKGIRKYFFNNNAFNQVYSYKKLNFLIYKLLIKFKLIYFFLSNDILHNLKKTFKMINESPNFSKGFEIFRKFEQKDVQSEYDEINVHDGLSKLQSKNDN